jgi:tRNA nucleotidyltransferase/poly(A) polymerase
VVFRLYTVNPLLKEVAGIFSRAGKQIFLVGGAVRDMVRGRKPADWDLATDAQPHEISALFPHTIPTGIKHGTVTVLFKGSSLEITTFRTEAQYEDGRHPRTVAWTSSITEDLSRRDFTMNALALDLASRQLCDPFSGEQDIRRRLIRCVGNPADRFSEDGLRALRAVRFAAQLNFSLDEQTQKAIPAALTVTARVSVERIRDEIDKIIACPRPSVALLLMEQTGLLALLLPELAACRGVEQKGFHRFDVLDHSLCAVDYAAGQDFPPPVRLAALLHDIGKVKTRSLDAGGVWTFYEHERYSAHDAGALLMRLRYPSATIAAVTHLIGEHMFHYTEDWTDAAVRRFIIRVGEENLAALYQLRRADSFALAGVERTNYPLIALMDRVNANLSARSCLGLKDLAISGETLKTIGIAPGPRMGRILKDLLEAVLDDPALNTAEKLLALARKKYCND